MAAFFVATAATAQQSTGPEEGVMCPGDSRCPASMPVPSLPQEATTPADQALGFRPTATREGVDDGRLEQQAYEATSGDGTVRRLVTSNTPVPNPAGRRPR